MNPHTVVIMGPSGSGKGTQATLLREYLQQHDPRREVLYVQVGKRFRELAEERTFTARLTRGYVDEGLLAPEFLTVWAWGTVLIEKFTGEQHLIFDGTPRKLQEAQMLDETLRFYRRARPIVAALSVSREWSRERLRGRGRKDDLDSEDVERRLDWYESETKPAIDFFREGDLCKVVEVNGEQNIEQVHKEILRAIR